MMPVAILAGGLATRLRTVAPNTPKALVPVGGRPFVEHQLAWLNKQGCTRVVMCVGHLGELIEAHVGNGERFGMHIDYSYDGPTLRGTGGALVGALPRLGDRFFVLYGDSYLRCSLHAVEQAFVESAQLALMTVMRNENQWDKSNTVFSSGRIVV